MPLVGRLSLVTIGMVLLMAVSTAARAEPNQIDTVVVEGHHLNLVGEAIAAAEGVIGRRELDLQPLSRTGAILELVPGMVVTQHSGNGKANQYFLRGFNLDHGTDFAVDLDGMPLNMRSHGHGQGYTDLNPVIPELVETLSYRKGTYYPEVGDFSGAGSSSIRLADQLDSGLLSVATGEYGYRRGLLTGQQRSERGFWLAALELNRYDGPWRDIAEQVVKSNGLLRFGQSDDQQRWTVTLMSYQNRWNSADQIPQRAVSSGLIDRFGSLDTSLGGDSSRYSVSANWQQGAWRLRGYAVDQSLDLWSNFTYFQDDPVNGDQFQQVDRRQIYGGDLRYQFSQRWADWTVEQSAGLQLRSDQIDQVGLAKSVARQRLGFVRLDRVKQHSVALYWQGEAQLTANWRLSGGARHDFLTARSADLIGENIYAVDLSANRGDKSDSISSLKASLSYTVGPALELYASAGQGFHSNDARGVIGGVDPSDGSVLAAVDPLVASRGAELGLRAIVANQLNLSLALWWLQLDSELLFVGDAGNT